jgi:hypothetical protein
MALQATVYYGSLVNRDTAGSRMLIIEDVTYWHYFEACCACPDVYPYLVYAIHSTSPILWTIVRPRMACGRGLHPVDDAADSLLWTTCG